MRDDAGTGSLDLSTVRLAACRAHESLRQDRILDDPFAAHLAGARVADVFNTDTEFATALRVVAIDELLQRAVIDHHLHAVVNLGAGLDSRPYRLSLPRDLRWVELDQDPVFAYKALRLAHSTPSCRIEHVGVDVLDSAKRDAVLRRVSRGVARGLLFSEDAPGRFAPTVLQELSARLPSGLKWWIVDALHQPGSERPQSAPANREFVEALCADSWRIVDCRPLEDEALRLAPDRLQRLHAGRDRPIVSDLGAVWMLHRSS